MVIHCEFFLSGRTICKRMVVARFGWCLGWGLISSRLSGCSRASTGSGDRFLQRVYTEGEIAFCLRKQRHSAESFAARFAAKEAGAKALGTGISRGVSWKEIEVTREPGERPKLRFSGRAAERAHAMGVRNVQLSLTHSREVGDGRGFGGGLAR